MLSSANNSSEIRRSISGPIGGGMPIPVPVSHTRNSAKSVTTNPGDSEIDSVERKNSTEVKPHSLMSKIFGNKKEEDEPAKSLDFSNISSVTNDTITSVEDFVPDDGQLDRSFLEEGNQIVTQNAQEMLESERCKKEASLEFFLLMCSIQKILILFSETETANPLVAGIEDDLSSGDESPPPIQLKLAENPLSKMDSKWRQSPEGGEDNAMSRKDRLELSDKSLDASVTSSNVHLELLDEVGSQRVSSDTSSPIMKEKKKHREKVIIK